MIVRIDFDSEWLICHFRRTRRVLQTYDLESVGNNADSHDLLSVVATVHHDGVGQSAIVALTTYIFCYAIKRRAQVFRITSQ